MIVVSYCPCSMLVECHNLLSGSTGPLPESLVGELIKLAFYLGSVLPLMSPHSSLQA